MQDKPAFFIPHKLQAVKKQLQSRLDRRQKARELLLPKEKAKLVDKVKSIFST